MINPTFNLSVFLKNSYQAFTGINLIHLNDSFVKSIAILLNHLSTYLIGILLNIIYRNRRTGFSFALFLKIVFLILYFSIYAFLSQNNAAGAVRYYSSLLPIVVTFIYIILPASKINILIIRM